MITLITGTPGAGKTAWLVQELTRLPSQRKIYVHGIPDLKVAHEPIYCTSELCEHCQTITQPHEDENGDIDFIELVAKPGEPVPLVEEWPYWATDGSLIVVDEVQRIWRPINSASRLPEEVAKLETHRHKGLDFWLVSQGPHLFHPNIRLLVGRHIHLVANWRGRNEYEWPECRQNVSSRSDAVIRPYKLPKQIFKLYKSASLHTKLDKRKPLSYYAFIACVVGVLFLGYRLFDKLYGNVAKANGAGVVSVQGDTPPNNTTLGAATPAPSTPSTSTTTPAQSVQNLDFKPQIEGRPETAPAYAHLLKVTAVPVLAGCIASKTSCKCYTQQATPYPMTFEQCREHIQNLHFNPFVGAGAVVASNGNP